MPFEKLIFRIRQSVRNDGCRIFVAMTSILEQRILVWVAFASASTLCPDNHYTGQMPYNNIWLGIRWWSSNISTDDWELDYKKGEVITFVIEFSFKSPSIVDFKVKVKLRTEFWVSVVSFTGLIFETLCPISIPMTYRYNGQKSYTNSYIRFKLTADEHILVTFP